MAEIPAIKKWNDYIESTETDYQYEYTKSIRNLSIMYTAVGTLFTGVVAYAIFQEPSFWNIAGTVAVSFSTCVSASSISTNEKAYQKAKRKKLVLDCIRELENK